MDSTTRKWRGAITLIVWIFAGSLLGSACRNEPETPPVIRIVDNIPFTTRAYIPRQLPAILEEGWLGAHVALQGVLRPALVGTLPWRRSFRIRLPAEPRLSFSAALVFLDQGARGIEIRFSVSIACQGVVDTVYSETFAGGQSRKWMDREIDLTSWSEREIELILETVEVSGARDPDSGVFVLWGNPVLDSLIPEDTRPHLILVSVDCLRADHTEPYGYQRPTTPHLSAFAEDATVFESAISTAPWTLPSHYSMFSGLPPSFHGVAADHESYWQGKARGLSSSVPYLPELLARAGYDTKAVVSSSPMSSRFGFQRGFGSFVEVNPDARAVVKVALNQGRRAKGRRLFLFVHFIDPHAPYLPKVNFDAYSSQFIERFGPRPKDISNLLEMLGARTPPRNSKDLENVTQLYDAAIAYVDENMGQLFEGLEKMGILQESVVIVTADHGEGLGEHGLWQHANSLYDELVRVPLIVSWPGGEAGRVRETASIMDIFPTLIEAAGIDPPPSEGVNLKNYVKSRVGRREFEGVSEVTLATPTGLRTLVSLRKRNLKYIATLRGSFDQISLDDFLTEELYDIAVDPQELEYSIKEREYSIQDFREALRSYLQSGRRWRSMWAEGDWVTPDAETKRKLESLGYVR